MFESVIASILLYELDTVTLTNTHLKRVDGTYLRLLRCVVGVKLVSCLQRTAVALVQ